MSSEAVFPAKSAREWSVGILLSIGGAGLFSLKGVVAKLAYAEGMTVSQALTWRMSLALPVYLIIGIVAFARTGPRLKRQTYALAAGLGVLSYYVSSTLDFWGLQYVTAQLERLTLYVYPTLTAVLSWVFLKERATRAHIVALGLAYLGVAILFGSEVGHQGPAALAGALAVMGAAVTFAIYVTASRNVIRTMGAPLFTCVAMSAAAAMFLIQSAVEHAASAPPPLTPRAWMLMGFLAIFCTVVPSFMTSEGIRRIGPGPMSAVGSVGPVFAAWAAVAVLGEPFGWPHVFAFALTMAGVGLLSRPVKHAA